MKVRIVYQSLLLLFVHVSFCYSEVVHIPDSNLESESFIELSFPRVASRKVLSF